MSTYFMTESVTFFSGRYRRVDILLDVMRARVIAWKSVQRGMINREDNGLIIAQFGPLITESEREFLLSMNIYHKDFKKPRIFKDMEVSG